MNELLVVVGAIFLVCMIVGYVRGFIKIVASLAATLAIIVLVSFLTPYVSGAILKYTPVQKMVEDKCMEIFLQEKPLDGQADVDMSEVELSRDTQIALIEQAKLPKVFQQLLIENNNREIYEALGVTTFVEYISVYLAKMMSNIVGFLVTMLLVTIIVRTILYVLGVIGDLPVIGGMNRLTGAVLGLGTGLVIVWVMFVAITMLYDTQIGKFCFEKIGESSILTSLYDSNLLMDYIMKFRG